jgi:hypothetical protein
VYSLYARPDVPQAFGVDPDVRIWTKWSKSTPKTMRTMKAIEWKTVLLGAVSATCVLVANLTARLNEQAGNHTDSAVRVVS